MLKVPEGLTDVKPIREIIYEYLKQSILDGALKPGSRLIERDIAALLNASRTPVREAIRKLESEGFIEYLPRKGVIVRGFNLQEIEEIFSIRKVLESLVIRCAIARITPQQASDLQESIRKLEKSETVDSLEGVLKELGDFDDYVTDMAQMPLLKNFIFTLKHSLQRYRQMNLADRPRREMAVKEHLDILKAVLDGDAERAEKLVRSHIDHSRAELMRKVSPPQSGVAGRE